MPFELMVEIPVSVQLLLELEWNLPDQHVIEVEFELHEDETNESLWHTFSPLKGKSWLRVYF